VAFAITPIYTQVVGAGGIGGIYFFNIPQTFTDLKAVISSRSAATGGFDSLGIYFNGSQANIANTNVNGNGFNAQTGRSTYRAVGTNDSAFATANTFASTEIYIPNYTSSGFKQMTVESVTENNAASSNLLLNANLWSQTAPITVLTFDNSTSGTNFVQYSTFSLYGITKG
jgi:hypothetical protein